MDTSIVTMDQEGPLDQGKEEIIRSNKGRKKLPNDDDVKYGCPQCPYKSGRRNNVDRHLASMHTASQRALVCCSQPFDTKASLLKHVRSSHASRGYMCADCGRAFARRALLLRHSTVHTGIKAFRCSSCSYGTSHKTNLARHCKAHGHQPPDFLAFRRHRKSKTSRSEPTSSGGESVSSQASSPELQDDQGTPAGEPAASRPPRLWQPWQNEEPLNLSQTSEDQHRTQGFLPQVWTPSHRPLPPPLYAHQLATISTPPEFLYPGSWVVVTLPTGQQVVAYEPLR